MQELAWSKPKLKHLATDLLRMIDQFNKFSNAVSSLVVSQPKIKVRKKVIEKLVRIAEVNNSLFFIYYLKYKFYSSYYLAFNEYE